jgi:hypothetical protein
MIEQIKAVIISELQSRIDEIKSEIDEKYPNLKLLEKDLVRALNEKNGLQEFGKEKDITNFPIPNHPKKSFSFIQRHITRRNEYQEQLKQYNEIKNLHDKEDKFNSIQFAKKLEESMAKISSPELFAELEDKQAKLAKVKSAQHLNELGMDLEKLFKYAEKKGIPIVLGPDDKFLMEDIKQEGDSKEVREKRKKEYSDLSALMGVHKTNFAPIGSKIRSDRECGVIYKEKILINGEEYEYTYPFERNTVHMAINHEVSPNDGGNWNKCKYAVLCPITDIPLDQIGDMTAADTYTNGGIVLSSKTWILCPASEVKRVQQNNPNVHVIGYEGDYVKDYPAVIMSALGYRIEKGNAYSFTDPASNAAYKALVEKNGKQTTAHRNSATGKNERMLTNINRFVAICGVVKDKGLVTNDQNKDEVLPDFCKGIKDIFELIFETEGLKEGEDKREVNLKNNNYIKILFKKLQEEGIIISKTYETMFKKIKEIGLSEFAGLKNLDSIFSELEGLSEEEQLEIEQLKQNFKVIEESPKGRDYGNDDKKKLILDFFGKIVLDSIEKSRDERTAIDLNRNDSEEPSL